MGISARCKDIIFFTVLVLFVLSVAAVIALSILYANTFSSDSTNSVVTTVAPATTPIHQKTSVLTTAVTTPAPTTEVSMTTNANAGRDPKLEERINCFPEQQGNDTTAWKITPEECVKRNCRFDTNTHGNAYAPICYMHPQDIGYKVTGASYPDSYEFQILTLEPISNVTIFDPPIPKLMFIPVLWSNQHLQIKITDMDNKRYEVPLQPQIPRDPFANARTSDFELNYTSTPFSFQVRRKSTGTTLFDSSMGGFVFSNRFLQLTSFLASKNFYGLGEHEHPSIKHDLDSYKTWPIFARDWPRLGERYSLYGTHPFYMVLENNGSSHGVFFLNSNAMEFSLIPAPGVIFRTIGGIIDLHIYAGPTPADVVKQHTSFIGRPFIPPYWAFGFHLSRFGYRNLTNMKAAIDRTRNAGIPLDAIFADIDHQDGCKDFTYDPVNFDGLPKYLDDERSASNLRSVIIIDPGIPNVPAGNYAPWTALNDKKAFVTFENGSTLFGKVWPADKVGFVDFFLKSAQDTWSDLIANYSKTLGFDGVWTDMNEPSNFGTNVDGLTCAPSDYEYPPYRTWAIMNHDTKDRKATLADATLCMEARQNNGQYRHYDVHNLYGWSQTPSTLRGIEKAHPGRRGFVLSRSTFAGSGQYATHWLGDNVAKWEHLQRSIIGMLEMSMFGIAHTGADICGFMDPTTPELCLRWMQLGAFYPYSRNHNDAGSPDQDPAVFGDEVARTSAYHMKMRYERLPYLYTLFYHANRYGSTVARPMFFEFPDDNATWALDRQFMLGPSLLVAPLLDKGKYWVSAYVPKGIWLSQTTEFCNTCEGGKTKIFFINGTVLLQRGGSIIPTQSTTVTSKYLTTEAMRNNPFVLNAVMDCAGKAKGSLFWDDGESIDTISNGKYVLAEYAAELDAKYGRLTFTSTQTHYIIMGSPAFPDLYFTSVVIHADGLSNLFETNDAHVTCKDPSTCRSVNCTSPTYTPRMLTCTFALPGIPIANNFRLVVFSP